MDQEDPESDLNFVLSRQGFFYFHPLQREVVRTPIMDNNGGSVPFFWLLKHH